MPSRPGHEVHRGYPACACSGCLDAYIAPPRLTRVLRFLLWCGGIVLSVEILWPELAGS